MFKNKLNKQIEKSLQAQITYLEIKIDKVNLRLTAIESDIKMIAEKLTLDSEKPKADDYNKPFSIEEYNKYGDIRIKSMEMFFAGSYITPEEHTKVLDYMDDETKKAMFKKTMDSFFKHYENRNNEPQSR